MTPSITPVAPWQEVSLNRFGGPWSRLDPTTVPPGQALSSANAEYQPGPTSVGTRFGFKQLFDLSRAYTTLYNWIKAPDILSTTGDYIVGYNSTNTQVDLIDLHSPGFPGPFGLFTLVAEGIDVASNGNQIFISGINATNQMTPVGATQCRVTGIPATGFFTDKAFLGPFTTKPTLGLTAVPAGGQAVTAGPHFFGYLVTTRNGFTGLINPVVLSSTTPDQTSSITADGTHAVSVSLTVAWPTEAASVQLVMTSSTNPYQFFIVPGTQQACSPFAINWTVAINDQNLITNATDCTNNQFFLTQDTMGNGPFNPFKVVVYGPRTVYMTYDASGIAALYVSDPNLPQQITEQFNKLKLPGFLKFASAFVLRGVLYVLGPHWTYAFQDNTSQPVTWPSATLVDGRIGTPCVLGTTVTSSGDWAAVAHMTGLWLFNGQYQDKPLSYLVDDTWRRINWNAAQTIRIADNHDKKQLAVLAPLDNATTPTHMLVFDYTDGLSYDAVKFSLWNFSGITPRGMTVFQNDTTQRIEWMLSSASAGPVFRQMNATDDTSPYADNTSHAIPFSYETALLSGGELGLVYAFPGMYIRVTGKGQLQASSYDLDHTITVPWSKPVILSAKPGVEYWRQFYLRGEGCSTKFSSGLAAGDWCQISGLRQKFYEWAQRR